MNEYEEYMAPSGELIQKYKEGSTWVVVCNKDDEVRWLKQYNIIENANKEFERWRK